MSSKTIRSGIPAAMAAGDVGKCPRCGRQSRSYSRGCSECGHGAPPAATRQIKARYLRPGMAVLFPNTDRTMTVAAVDQHGDTVHVRYVDTAVPPATYPYDVEEAVTVVGDRPETAADAPEPDSRQRLAAELHRIADDIAHTDLPFGRHASLHLGVLASRADLGRWAAHLGSPVKVNSDDIPAVSHQVRIGEVVLRISVQSQREPRSELERLRARVAELEAEHAQGGTR